MRIGGSRGSIRAKKRPRSKISRWCRSRRDYLHPADDVNVAAVKKRFQVESGHALRQRRHGKEMQERVRAEEDEDEPEKDAGNNSQNFHGARWCMIPVEFPIAK